MVLNNDSVMMMMIGWLIGCDMIGGSNQKKNIEWNKSNIIIHNDDDDGNMLKSALFTANKKEKFCFCLLLVIT